MYIFLCLLRQRSWTAVLTFVTIVKAFSMGAFNVILQTWFEFGWIWTFTAFVHNFEMFWISMIFNNLQTFWCEVTSMTRKRFSFTMDRVMVYFHIVWTCWAVVTFVTKMSDWYDMLNPYVCSKITILWCLKFAIGA